MSIATLKATIDTAVEPEGTFTVDYTSQEETDFTASQTVDVSVYGGSINCAVSFGASAATVTWPADADYDLPAGEYYIDFDLVGGDQQDRFDQMENQADSEATDAAGVVVDFNLLLDKLKASGLMQPDS